MKIIYAGKNIQSHFSLLLICLSNPITVLLALYNVMLQ